MLEQQDPISKLQKLHSSLLKEGYDIPKDFDAFKTDMQNESKLKSLHSSLLGENYDLPDFNTFKSDMAVGQEGKLSYSGPLTINGKKLSEGDSKSFVSWVNALPTEKPGKASTDKGGYKGTGLTEQEAMLRSAKARIESGQVKLTTTTTAEDVKADLRKKEEERKAEEKKSVDNAVFNLVERKSKKAAQGGVAYTKEQLQKMTDDFTKKVESGELKVTYDKRNGQSILAYANSNPFTSFLDGYNNIRNENQEDQYIKTLSPKELVNHYEALKEQASVDETIGREPSGFGLVGGIPGTLLGVFEKPIVYGIGVATGAGALSGAAGLTGAIAEGTMAAAGGESVAASTAAQIKNANDFTTALAFMQDNARSSYSQSLYKTYNGILRNNPNATKEEKISAASNAMNAAQKAEVVGGIEGALFSMPLTKAAKGLEASAKGYGETLLASAKHTIGDLPKFAAISGGGSALKGGIGAYYGSGETAGEITKEALGAAAESAVMPIELFGINALKATVSHAWTMAINKAQAPSKAAYSRSLSVVSKFPDETIASVYGKAESDGVVPMGTKNSILQTIRDYREAESLVPKTVTDTNVKDALSGKLLKRLTLEKELKETKINARKAEITNELVMLDNDIDNIYNGQDPLIHETDDAGNQLEESEPTEIQGLNVVKRAPDGPNGEVIYEVEGGRFLTPDGKEVGVVKQLKPEIEVEQTDIETKKADIERRRQEELTQYEESIPGVVAKEFPYEGSDNIPNEINARYDAELKALKEAKPVEQKYTQTEEGIALDKEAKNLGFDNVTHAINSVNEALGKDYKTFQEIKPEEFKEAIDIRNHNKAFEQTVKGTEYEIKTGDTEIGRESIAGAEGEVSAESAADEPISYADAGFRSEEDARAAYESDTEREPDESYEEWKFIKYCGEI